MESIIHVRRHTALVAAVVLGAVCAALAWGAPQLTPKASAQTVVKRKISVVIKCTLTRGATETPCRGTFKITGAFKDSGKLFESSSKDPAGRGATFRALMKGASGDIRAVDSGIYVTHKRKACVFAASFDLRGETGRYEGFRGATNLASCTKLVIGKRTIKRVERFNVKLEKRVG